jgi:hypothetical protein
LAIIPVVVHDLPHLVAGPYHRQVVADKERILGGLCDVRFTPKADIVQHGRDVGFVPNSEIATAALKMS